jgi:ubiquitin-protein ligase
LRGSEHQGPAPSAEAKVLDSPIPRYTSTHQDACGLAKGRFSTMHQSPRMRRLRNDLAALERLQSESTVFRFKAQGNPPQQYLILLRGKSLWRVRGNVHAHESHRVEIKLGASYPRTMPEIRWVTPIYHPNISEIGMVCLGGYGTHWVPSIQLDELCNMLWDMARYHNYDIRSPYNRDAALWVASQTTFLFPVDSRPLRDLRAAMGRIASASSSESDAKQATAGDSPNGASNRAPANGAEARTAPARVRDFMDRYKRIFRKTASPATSSTPAIASSELSGAVVQTQAPAPPDPIPAVHPPDDEEIILLESDSPIEPPGESAPRYDGITFIE